jgi:cellulose biosynthesis protein BcsQ
VSGKGGVGKTTLAANLAYLIATSGARVLLIDLDFHNMGCTGVFASRYRLGRANARELLQNLPAESPTAPQLTPIDHQLWFLPASLIVQPVQHQDALFQDARQLCEKLDQLLARLHQWFSIDCFVLDCHGGIEPTTVAAAGVCEHTLIVTEADTVSFAGTLGLVDSYYEYYATADWKPRIDYIVNRIPPKYKWKDLDRLYRKYLERHLGRYTPTLSVLCYMPVEGYVADTFGDYPFQAQLAPAALFTRKLELIVHDLLGGAHPNLASEKIRKRFVSRRYADKIRQRVISAEAQNVRTVLTSYGLSALFFLCVFPLYLVLSVLKVSALYLSFPVLAALIGLYYVVGMFKSFSYFREKLKFHKKILELFPGERSGWKQFVLWKLRALYYATLFGFVFPCLVLLAVVLLIAR